MKQILVTNKNIDDCLEELSKDKYIGLDTETYGLRKDDDMFSLQLANEDYGFYFNFLDYGKGGPYVWDESVLLDSLRGLFSSKETTWFIHNAKFDMHKLHNFNCVLDGVVHCTQAIERIIYNQHRSYSLAATAKRYGYEKDESVGQYITKNKLTTKVKVDGKLKPITLKHFDQVPFEILLPYGTQDAWLHYMIGRDQLAKLNEIYDDETRTELYNTETQLTKVCFQTEVTGVKVDESYIHEAKNYEQGCLEDAKSEASELAHEEFRNGPKWLASAFDRCGQAYDINPKTGNPIFDKEALARMESPIAEVVREIRTREKYISTYYSSFLYHSDDRNIVRANINQAGTDTGRFSYSDPNLQNIPKEEDFQKGDTQVRKCFVPREDHCFVMIDYDQQEYRLMLDYAGEMEVIHRIAHDGEDVHQVTADMMGVSRTYAKRINFGLLYGMGDEELSRSLKLPLSHTKELKLRYFSRLPKVERLLNHIKQTAKTRKYIKTWTGRKLHFPKQSIAYKAPNHLIQGGCADITKRAMLELEKLTTRYYDANILIQVHDEIVFEVHKDRLDIVPELKRVMENIYKPMNGMNLTCGVEYSWDSWGKQDVIDGYPN